MTQKLGIQFSPPALVLVYPVEAGKIHKRTMPVRNFRADSNVSFVASEMRLRHDKFLQTIPLVKIQRMLRILQEHMKGASLQEAIEKVEAEFEVNPNEDLNKLSSEELERKKLIMDASFITSQVQPSDPDFEYDKRMEFQDEKIESAWDTDGAPPFTEEDGDDFWG